MKIMFRHTQVVKPDKWEEKLEMERLSDIAERKAGHPVPRRYRAMIGGQAADIRVIEREYDSFEEFARLWEEGMKDPELLALDGQNRRGLIDSEQYEVFIVDYMPGDDPNRG